LVLTIPDEIKDYITIIPSDHNIEVAPQFFDFENINVVTIRDGFMGQYYYKLTINDDFPESLMGKVYSIGIDIDETYFDRLPGYNDPTSTGYHDYTLKVPPIKFGVPYPSGHLRAGKVYYTNGYSTDLYLSAIIPKSWNLIAIKPISNAEITSIRAASGD